MHSTPFDYILTDKKTHHDPDMNNTSCQILRATRVQTATTRIGEGAHDTCLLKHQCASSASQRVKENNRSFAQRWLEKTERPEPLTVCSTLGCRCAFHGYSLSSQMDLGIEPQITGCFAFRSKMDPAINHSKKIPAHCERHAAHLECMWSKLSTTTRHVHHGIIWKSHAWEKSHRTSEPRSRVQLCVLC